MPIADTDIRFRLSGGAANSSPVASLGGAKSSVTGGANVFDSISGAENSTGDIEYRCIYVHNAHGSLTLHNATAWIDANTPSGNTTIEIALGSSAINGTEQTVADEGSAPTGVTFLAAVNKAGGILLGDIPPGQHRAFWLKRILTPGATPTASDTFTVAVEIEDNNT